MGSTLPFISWCTEKSPHTGPRLPALWAQARAKSRTFIVRRLWSTNTAEVLESLFQMRFDSHQCVKVCPSKEVDNFCLSKENVNITAFISKSVINWRYIWVECRVNSRENQLSRWLSGKESSCQAGHVGLIPGPRDPLEKELATHSSILVWKIPWTEETGGLQFIGSQ